MAEEEVEFEYVDDEVEPLKFEYVDPEEAAPQQQDEAAAETVPEFAHDTGAEPEGDESYFDRLYKHLATSHEEIRALKAGIQRGQSFGFSKHMEKLDPIPPEMEKFAKTGQYIGEFLPLSGLINVFQKGALKLAATSPILKQQMASLANIVGVGAAGATKEAAEAFTQGDMPDAEKVINEGLYWSAIDIGLRSLGTAGKFTKSLIDMARGKEKGTYQTLREIVEEMRGKNQPVPQADRAAAEAMEILERKTAEAGPLKPRGREVSNLKHETAAGKGNIPYVEGAREKMATMKPPVQGRELKVTNESVNKLSDQAEMMAKIYTPQNLSFAQESARIAESGIVRGFDAVAPRAATEAGLGTAIKEDVNKTLKAAKKEYKPLYTKAEEAAEGMLHKPKATAEKAGEILKDLERLETKPPGYEKTMKDIESALKDAGYKVERDAGGAITRIGHQIDVTVASTINLAKRLNEIADFESLVPSVKDNIKKIAHAAKADVREGLKPNNEALAAFEMAEKEHAEVAARYGKDSIMKVRGEQAGERITQVLDQPSTLGDLKATVSKEQFAQIEREVLERLNKLGHEKGKDALRELKPHLTDETAKLAEQVVNSKNPLNHAARKAATQQGILNELADSFVTGQRPEKALNLWKTPQGQKLVSETLEHSPNRAKVTKYLNDQTFNDTVASVMKDGAIDAVKLGRMMSDKGTVDNIRRIGGEDAVKFFRGMESRMAMLQTNSKLVGKLPTNEQILSQTVKNSKQINELSKGRFKIENGVQAVDKEAQAAAIHRGNVYLDRLMRKNYPLNAKINDWEKYIKERLGFTGTTNMNVFGLTKLGIAKTAGLVAGSSYGGVPQTVMTMVGYQAMRRFATSPTARKQFIKASQPQATPFEFIEAMRALGDSLQDESYEK